MGWTILFILSQFGRWIIGRSRLKPHVVGRRPYVSRVDRSHSANVKGSGPHVDVVVGSRRAARGAVETRSLKFWTVGGLELPFGSTAGVPLCCCFRESRWWSGERMRAEEKPGLYQSPGCGLVKCGMRDVPGKSGWCGGRSPGDYCAMVGRTWYVCHQATYIGIVTCVHCSLSAIRITPGVDGVLRAMDTLPLSMMLIASVR